MVIIGLIAAQSLARLFPNLQLTVADDGELPHTTMSLLANIVGFSLFGLAARVGQLGIQKRNLFDSKSRSPSAS